MKVLLINGSPKGVKSNSLKLAEAFVSGMGAAEVEILHLAERDIRPCMGCYACWKTVDGGCVIKDDVKPVLEQMLNADVLIWSFPLYYFSVPGLLKNLIDRQLPLLLPFMAERTDGVGSGSHTVRHDRSWQRHVLISTCGFYSAQGNYDSVCRMFDHISGDGCYAKIFCGQGELFGVPELKSRTDEYLGLVRQAGQEYLSGGISGATGRQLEELLFPKEVFEAMADASWGIEESGAAQGELQVSRKGASFTRQMAALYNKAAYDGKDRVLEFYYTDLDETYQILMNRDGYLFLTEDFKTYTTRIETPFTVWNSISTGEISGTQALADRKYRVLGDFTLMLEWDTFFFGGSGGETGGIPAEAAGAKMKTNMNILLAPWMVIWILLSIDTYWGGIAGILAAAAMPLCWIRYKATVYEYVSVFAVALLSLAALLQVDVRAVVIGSYLLFGLIWGSSVFRDIPLTACYSQNSYGGKKALQNPLFMKTNRILTGCWAGLYLITPLWTWFLMQGSLASYTGLLNSVCPAAMGVFTVWFQRWYPAKVAGA